MTLIIREEEVTRLLTMQDTLDAVEGSFRSQGEGTSINRPRRRFHIPGRGNMQLMSGVCYYRDAMGLKVYTSFRTGTRFMVLLFSAETGDLLSIVQADNLGRMRTGAASGVATKYLAKEGASTVGMIGSGGQAATQLEAVCAVRNINQARVFSRRPEPLAAFCTTMSEKLGIDVSPAPSPEEAVTGADVIVTITNARDPVVKGEWVSEGAHINAAGSNSLARKEIDNDSVRKSDIITVDSREQAQLECGDLLVSAERGVVNWETVTELGDVVSGKTPSRTSDSQITLFESQGLAIQDVATATKIYELALANGLGQEIDIF